MPLIIFGLLLGGLVVGMGVWGLRKGRAMQSAALADQERARGWSETQARVLSARVEDVRHGYGRSRIIKAVPHIEYEYEVGGRTYWGSRVRFGVVEFNLPSNAKALVDRYSAGSIIRIRHDPQRPGESVIEPVANAQTGMKVAIGICSFLIVFGAAFGSLIVYAGLTMR